MLEMLPLCSERACAQGSMCDECEMNCLCSGWRHQLRGVRGHDEEGQPNGGWAEQHARFVQRT